MDVSNNTHDILSSFLHESQLDAIDLLSGDQQTLSLIEIFKPILYPVDLFKKSKDESLVYSLVRMCSLNIIRDDEFFARKYLSVPVQLYDCLMTFAIDNDFSRCIAVLMSRWPSEEISVAKLLPDVLDNWNNLTDNGSKFDCLSNGMRKYIRCLVSFLDYVRAESKSPLRVLDLRGMPMGDRVMDYLIEEINFLSIDDFHLDDYRIILDGVICTLGTCKSLMYYFASKKSKLHLHFNKLDLSHLSEVKSWLLLKEIDPKELVGLSVRATLSSGNFCQLIIRRFTKLVALEITHPDYRRMKRCKPLSFRFAPNLKRLLFSAPLYYLSDVVPASDIQQLECLNLNDGSMSRKDESVLYLASLPLSFCELNLFGHLIIDQQVDIWVKLFKSLVPTLKILEMEWCLNTENCLSTLLKSILPLLNLRYLNLARNVIRMQTFCQIAPELSSLPALELVKLPYIDESFVHHVSVPDDTPAELRRNTVEGIFATKKPFPVNIVWAPYAPNYL